MDLGNKTLSEWLRKAPAEKYPQGDKKDHHSHYVTLRDHLKDNVHPSVVLGATLHDDGTLINDHGIDHIDTVIKRASYLVDCDDCELCPYEVYLLLCCIELHDIGNVFGRKGHEKAAREIMDTAVGVCGRDTVEKITINKIIQTHGGVTEEGEKDKIVSLAESEGSMYGNFRPRLIASILRFADEIADDRFRANTKLLNDDILPKGSEVFHAYATCLNSVEVNHKEKAIELNYKIHKSYLIRRFGKLKEEVFLLDEIYNRLMKMHLERIYCSRFWKGRIEIEKIVGSIEFYADTIDTVFPSISFEIRETGYPTCSGDIFTLAPAFTDSNGHKMDGEYIKSEIEKEK